MPATEACSENSLAVQVNLGGGQKLRYTVHEGAGVNFTLRTEVATTLLSSETPARVHVWPVSSADGPSRQPATHALGMVLGQAGAALRYRIELLDSNGTVISVVKNCTYSYDGEGSQTFRTALSIFTT